MWFGCYSRALLKFGANFSNDLVWLPAAAVLISYAMMLAAARMFRAQASDPDRLSI